MTKKLYIEWLRIIAILFVIYNHTRTFGFELFTVTSEKLSYWLSFMMYPLCKTAVPIFLMISGVTLLNKQETLKELYKKRILKHVLIIVIFGSLQYLRYLRTGKVVLSLSAWFSSIYCQPVVETYWFLYLYLGFLLLLPILRNVVMTMKKQEYLYLFVLYCGFNVLTLLGYFTGYFINANIFNLANIIFYPLMGYGIDKYGCEIKKFLCILSQ